MGMAKNNARMATGTFTANGTSNVILDIGFKPDVVYISCGYDNDKYAQSGWVGTSFLAIFRNETILNLRHSLVTSTSAAVGLNLNVGGSYGEYGSTSAPSQTFYATYSDGVLFIQNKSPDSENAHFIADETYTWIAFAAA